MGTIDARTFTHIVVASGQAVASVRVEWSHRKCRRNVEDIFENEKSSSESLATNFRLFYSL